MRTRARRPKREKEKAKSRPTTPKKDKGAKSRPTTPIPIALPTLGMHSRSGSEDSLDLSFDSTLSGGIPLPPSFAPGSALAPKARQLLFGLGLGEGGVAVGEGSSGNFKTPSWRENGPYQPPGLVLMPSTLIPCLPMELEMHACKHMNTLLGCRYALARHLAGQRDLEGRRLLSEKEVDDFLWDYEW